MDQQVELLEFQNEVLRVMLAVAYCERDQLAQQTRRLAEQNRRLLTDVPCHRLGASWMHTSYNIGDSQKRYCSYCHKFHEDAPQ